jgi:outer membrane protein OmpA-like peptidoglycan-associated protein
MRRQHSKGSSLCLHRATVGLVLATAAGLCISVLPAGSILAASKSSTTKSISRDASAVTVPVGAADSSEPSGQAPPGTDAMPGYQRSYVTDFTGSKLPAGWAIYTGKPGGDPGAQWGQNHVTVSGGMLQLNTWQDPAYGGEWVAGGLCQCNVTANTYGAYFVRSRVTGPGPTQVELLWPTSGWPPEIDFDETFGGVTSSSATLHWSAANDQTQTTVNANMEQWHTWGVIWTPTSVTYTLDGSVWGQVDVAADVPHQRMTLDLQQQTWCDEPVSQGGPAACPTAPESTQVDWVAEYQATTPTTTTSPSTTTTTSTTTTSTTTPLGSRTFTLGPFAANSSSLTPHLRAQIDNLARDIADTGYLNITLTGYGERSGKSLDIIHDRAIKVDRLLKRQLRELKVSGVDIAVKVSAKPKSLASAAGKPVVLARILTN